jgi:hypothetical protein
MILRLLRQGVSKKGDWTTRMYEVGLHEGEVLACQELLDRGEVEDGPALVTAGGQEQVVLSR